MTNNASKAKSKSASRRKVAARVAKARSAAPARAKPGNPLLSRWSAAFGLPPFKKIEPAHFKAAFAAALKEHKAEIARHRRRDGASRRSPTPSSRWRRAAACSIRSPRFSTTSPARTPTRRCRRSSATWRRSSPRTRRRSCSTASCSAAWRISISAATSSPSPTSSGACWSCATSGFVRAGAKLGAQAEGARRRDQPAAGDAGDAVLPERAEGRAVLAPGAGRARSRRTAGRFARRRRRAPAPTSVSTANTSSRCRARASSRSCSSRRAAICARRRSTPGSSAARWARRPTTAPSPPRSSRCAPSSRRCSASRPTPSTASTTRWPRRRPSVRGLLSAVWEPAVKRAASERDALQSRAREEGGNFAIAPWDWRYYAEKERKARYDVDEASTRPYLTLDNVIAAAFETATRLFGLRFKELPDAPRYHEDVRVWEVTDKRGAHVGLFLGDYFARPSKRSGAWMSAFRSQSKVAGEVTPDHRQRDELRQRRGGRAEPAVARRRAHAVPRVRARPARAVVGRDLSVDLRHGGDARLRRAALAALRALADGAGGAGEVRRAPRDRQADAGEARRRASRRRATSIRASRPSSTWLRRSSTWSCTRSRTAKSSTSTPSSATRWTASACRAKSSCATACRTSCTSWAATRRGITATCGRK